MGVRPGDREIVSEITVAMKRLHRKAETSGPLKLESRRPFRLSRRGDYHGYSDFGCLLNIQTASTSPGF